MTVSDKELEQARMSAVRMYTKLLSMSRVMDDEECIEFYAHNLAEYRAK
jgi:hypothetical protein